MDASQFWPIDQEGNLKNDGHVSKNLPKVDLHRPIELETIIKIISPKHLAYFHTAHYTFIEV